MIVLHLLSQGPNDPPLQGAPVGRLDLPVSATARALWPQVKEELLALGIQRVLTSDLARAREHALDLGLPCLVLPDLAEQAFGEWDAVPWAENRAAESFFSNPVQASPPGGESFARCASRTLMALQGALEGEVPTLVLAHGGPLRAILAHFMGLPLERALDLAWRPFGLTKLELHSSNRGTLRYHNRPLPSPGASGML